MAGPVETPSSMAQSARNTIQASASQIWSSIRTNLDIESMKRQSGSSTRSSSDDEGVQQQLTSLESVMRAMFSSCTTGGVAGMEETTNVTITMQSGCPPTGDQEVARNLCPQSVREEAVYERLFMDSKLRAEEAVSHLREQLEQKKEEWASVQKQASLSAAQEKKLQSGGSGAIPKPFPISNPSSKREISIPSKVTDGSGPSNGGAHRSSSEGVTSSPLHAMSMSFDDGISAISAQTLDEMARMYEADETLLLRVHSDVTQDPAEPAMENWKKTHAEVYGGSPQRSSFSRSNPLSFTRTRTNRSHGTMSTHRSKGARSMATKSTLSSQTTDFANAWKRDEQKYWQDVVKADDIHNDIDPAADPTTFVRSRDLHRPEMVSLVCVMV